MIIRVSALVGGLLMLSGTPRAWSAEPEPPPVAGLEIELTGATNPVVRLTLKNASGTRQAVLFAPGIVTNNWSTLTNLDVPGDSASVDDSATNSAGFYTLRRFPVLPADLDNRTNIYDEETLVTITNAAPGFPSNSLFYELTTQPATDAKIGSDGVITWTTSEAQGPGIYVFTTVVRDGGSPTLKDTNSFVVAVNEVNVAPFLKAQSNRTIAEFEPLSVMNSADDGDQPTNQLTYALQSPAAGATINTNGVIAWTPSELDGGKVFTFTTIVNDNGSPPMRGTNTFVVDVNELNAVPSLKPQANRVVEVNVPFEVNNAATDDDVPANLLSYQLMTVPHLTNAFINSSGVITWTNTMAQWPGIYSFITEVTDNGVPVGKAANSFTVEVTNTNLARIPAGTFLMGDNLDDTRSALPVHEVTVREFYMMPYEVWGSLWDEVYQWAITNGYEFDSKGSAKGSLYPVANVTWYNAVKWCNARSQKEGRRPAYYTSTNHLATTVYRKKAKADLKNEWVDWESEGYRLPTEAEWEMAARGDLSGKRFTWGDVISHDRANYFAAPGTYAYDLGPAGYHPSGGSTAPRTTLMWWFPQTESGLCNLAGNVEEWCWDWSAAYPNEPQTDPHGPNQGSSRILRGGAWNSFTPYTRVAARNPNDPTYRSSASGFRCVVSPKRRTGN